MSRLDLNIYYDSDCDTRIIKFKTVAIIGFGSQGHAHAQNLRESGVRVIVGVRKGTSWSKAEAKSFEVMPVAEAVAQGDVIMVLTPDEHQAELYRDEIEPHLKKGATIGFGHGFSIHYGYIKPRKDRNVIMIAPKAPGHTVRSTYVDGSGTPMLVAVQQDTGDDAAKQIALSYASAIGGGRVGIIETTFKDETETDLFGEQTVLCGGFEEMIKMAFETLVAAGYPPEMAYFECLHETKLIADLVYQGGLSNMNYSISNNAEYGGYVTGPKVINDQSRIAMEDALKNIQDGSYATRFVHEGQNGYPFMEKTRKENAEHQIEVVGAQLRGMMPFIKANQLVDKNVN